MTSDPQAPIGSIRDGSAVAVTGDGDTRVVLGGEIDLATADAVRSAIDAALESTEGDLEVDVREVSFMDSTGLGLIAIASDRVGDRGGKVVVVGASATVRRLFQVSGLDAVIEVA